MGEELGLGRVFVSQRWNVKEAATLAGAVGAVSSEIGIATAATHHSTRHPLVTASHATTMHTLTGGRYTLGRAAPLGRLRAPADHHRQLEDFAGLMRRLFHGEAVVESTSPRCCPRSGWRPPPPAAPTSAPPQCVAGSHWAPTA